MLRVVLFLQFIHLSECRSQEDVITAYLAIVLKFICNYVTCVGFSKLTKRACNINSKAVFS